MPRRGHVGDVGRERRPPERLVAGRRPRGPPGGGAGVHHQRPAARHERLEQRGAALPALALGQRAGRQREADEPGAQHRVEGGGIGLDERRHGPAAEAVRQLQHALVVRVGDRRWPRPAAGTRCRRSSSARSARGRCRRGRAARGGRRRRGRRGRSGTTARPTRSMRQARVVARSRRRGSSRRRRRASTNGSGQMCW